MSAQTVRPRIPKARANPRRIFFSAFRRHTGALYHMNDLRVSSSSSSAAAKNFRRDF